MKRSSVILLDGLYKKDQMGFPFILNSPPLRAVPDTDVVSLDYASPQ